MNQQQQPANSYDPLILILVVAILAILLWQSGILNAAGSGTRIEVVEPQSAEPAIILVPEPATAAVPTVTPEPTPTLPALPAMGPYTLEQHGACFDVFHQGRLDELPEPQQSLCKGYVGVGQ